MRTSRGLIPALMMLLLLLVLPSLWARTDAVDEDPGYFLWRSVHETLEMLRLKPLDPKLHEVLEVYLQEIPERSSWRTDRCGIMTLNALSRIGGGSAEGARDLQRQLRRQCGSSGFGGYLGAKVVGEKCRKCNGSGIIEGKCPTCRGGGRCPQCRGKRFINETVIVEPERTAPRRLSNPGLGGGDDVRGLGDSRPAPPPPPPEPVKKTIKKDCPTCKGSGDCPQCLGVRRTKIGECPECGGNGNTFSKRRLLEGYKQCIDAYEPYILKRMAAWEVKQMTARVTTKQSQPGPETYKRLMGKQRRSPAFQVARLAGQEATGMRLTTSGVSHDGQGTLLDTLFHLSTAGSTHLAPDTSRMADLLVQPRALAEIRVTTLSKGILEACRESGLEPSRIRLAGRDDVVMLAGEAFKTYSMAVRRLAADAPLEALKLLPRAADPDSQDPYSQDVTALRQLLEFSLREGATLKELRERIAEGLKDLEQATQAAEMNTRVESVGLARPDGGSKPNIQGIGGGEVEAREKNKKRAEAAMAKAIADFKDLRKAFLDNRQRLQFRIRETVTGRLHREHVYLMTYAETRWEEIKKLQWELNEAGFKVGEYTGIFPQTLKTLREAAETDIRRTRDLVKSGSESLSDNLDLALFQFTTAAEISPASLPAVAGQGYALTQRFRKGIEALTRGPKPTPFTLSGKFGGRGKSSYVRHLSKITEGRVPLPLNEPVGAVSRANTILLGDLKAVVSVSANAFPEADSYFEHTLDPTDNGIWKRLNEMLNPLQKMESRPIILNMLPTRIGEVETYLEALAWGNRYMKDAPQALQVTIPNKNLLVDIDSAGTAIAVAMQSSLDGKPVRNSVVMAGGLNRDGSLEPIDHVAAKVMRASDAMDIELILLPNACEAALAIIPPDVLCENVIVLAKDMYDFKAFATDPEYKAEGLQKLRAAQIHFLLRERDKAEVLLKEVAPLYPEFYNAKRLLEFMAIYTEL